MSQGLKMTERKKLSEKERSKYKYSHHYCTECVDCGAC